MACHQTTTEDEMTEDINGWAQDKLSRMELGKVQHYYVDDIAAVCTLYGIGLPNFFLRIAPPTGEVAR
jgi:hypothetical protein